MPRVVTLLSGGLDSATLAYDYATRETSQMHCLSFNYGQRHAKELLVAAAIAERLGARHHIVNLGVAGPWEEDLRPLGEILGDSALVTPRGMVDVPDGHYADENMKATVVPNRNAIMLSIAYAVAVAEKASIVAFAAHAGDHAIYPDCRPAFVFALNEALQRGNMWDSTTPVPTIVAPFVRLTKGDIAIKAHQLGVPIADTWSCYKGGDTHCGTCGTCYERREALKYAESINPLAWQDPTTYLDATTTYEAPR